MTAKYGPNTGLLESMAQGDQWTSDMHVALRGHDFLLQPVVKSMSLTVPPVSPSDGDAYVVATGGSGLWSGHDTQIARWTITTNAWEFLTPKSGWLVTYGGAEYMFNGSAWAAYSGGSGGSGTVTSIGFSAPAAGMTISGTNPITTTGTWAFAFADDLGAIESLSGTGYARRTGTSTWTTGPVYLSAGALTEPTYTDNGNGSVTIGNADVALYNNATGSGIIDKYTLTGGTFTLTDGVSNYIVGDYNSGAPIMRCTTNLALVDNITIVPLFTITRDGTKLHYLDWDEIGDALANRMALSIVKTNRFRRESGLTLGELTGRVITLTAGVVWYGTNAITLAAVNSSTDTNSTTLFYHTGGAWAESIVTQYNNTQYDDGTNLQTLSNNSYGTIFVYRGVENAKALYLLLGGASYTLAGAQEAQPPANVPALISSVAMLVGRIIVLKSASTAIEIDSAFTTLFTQSAASNHNDLSGLQGGAAGEYYHLTSAQYTLATQYSSSTQAGLLSLTDWNTFNQKEPALGSPGTSGYLLSSTSGGTRSWVAPYSLPIATASVLGGVKPDGTSILNSSGAISATAASVGAEPALGNPATSGYILSSTSAGVRSWIAMGGGLADAPSDGSTYGRKNAAWVVVSGTGTVTGPGSSTDGHVALFNGTTGQLLKDGGALTTSIVPEGSNLYFTNARAIAATLTGFTAATSSSAISAADSVLAALQKVEYRLALDDAKATFPGYGTTGSTACAGNDSRLSDARTPTSHTLVSHTASGLTGGQLLLATGATTYAFTTITGDVAFSSAGAASIAAATVTGKLLTGLSTASGGTVSATDSILAAIGKFEYRITKATETRTAVADAAQTVSGTNNQIIAYTSITAARVVTLPAATTAGQRITVIDESGSCNGTKTITITRAGSDTIEGQTTFVLSSAYGAVTLVSNGTSKWTSVAPEETRLPVADAAYTVATGRDVIVSITSLSAARAITLPAATVAGQRITVLDESGSCSATNTLTITRAGSDTIDGATTLVLQDAYATATLVADGTSKWSIVARLPLKVTLTYSWAWETAVTTSDWQPCYQFRQACTLKAIRAFQDSGTSSFTASTITIYKNGSSWKTCNLPASWTSGTWTDISTGLSDSLSSGDYITAVVTTAGTHLKVTLELETEQQAH